MSNHQRPTAKGMVSRRSVLGGMALTPAAAAATAGGSLLLADATRAQGLILPNGNVCMVTPEVTEGPFYLDTSLVRSDIREDRQGIPLRIMLQVVEADCTPIEGARVDLWHADSAGYYSGTSGQGSSGTQSTVGQTFLRGTQMTDPAGVVGFDSIYPGWYPGRTPHVHYKVFLDERTVLTSQFFLLDALSAFIFANVRYYSVNVGQTRDTFNRTDPIATEAGPAAFASVKEEPTGLVAMLIVGVDRGGAL